MSQPEASEPVRLAAMDWPWRSEDPVIHIILISDEQFISLAARPDEAVEKMYPWADAPISLREYCGRARRAVRRRCGWRMITSSAAASAACTPTPRHSRPR